MLKNIFTLLKKPSTKITVLVISAFIISIIFSSYFIALTFQTKRNMLAPDNRKKPIKKGNISANKRFESISILPLESLIKEMKSEVFGYSVQGKAIMGYVFGDGEETILLIGAIHGHEKSSSILLDNIIKDISSNPGVISKSKRVVIIPLVNPDGYSVGLDKVNASNVNLNINFQTTGWKKYGGEDNKYFAGDTPFSEPESRVIRDVVLTYGVDKMLSYHAKGNLINPEIHAPSEDLARWYVGQTGYSFYEDISWDYPGTATRWFTENIGGPAITVELPDYNDPDLSTHKKAIFELLK